MGGGVVEQVGTRSVDKCGRSGGPARTGSLNLGFLRLLVATPNTGFRMNWSPPERAGILTRTPRLQHAFLVGGCVRDALLGRTPKDFDLEVFGVTYEQLIEALAPSGRTDLVGKSFGVIKLTTGSGTTYEFSIPRRDSKMGAGHRGFTVDLDPAISPREASSRRDFTINAIAYDVLEDRLIDPFDGAADLARRMLRAVGVASERFAEDGLRVLRGARFVASLELELEAETGGAIGGGRAAPRACPPARRSCPRKCGRKSSLR